MAKRVKFYLDEHVPHAVAKGLTRHGIEVITTTEAHTLGRRDVEHVEYALAGGWTIFTQDQDFLKIAATGKRHGGIVFARQSIGIGRIIEQLREIFEKSGSSELQGTVRYLLK